MPDSYERRQERDAYLARKFTHAADTLRSGFSDWIQEELKELLYAAERIEAMSSGIIEKTAREIKERIQDIDRRELMECRADIRVRITEVEEGPPDDLFDDRCHLEMGLYRFERIVRELILTRRALDKIESSNDGTADEHDTDDSENYDDDDN